MIARRLAAPLLLSFVAFGCTRPGSTPLETAATAETEAPSGSTSVTSVDGSGATASSAAPASAASPAAPLPGGDEPTPDKALPELRIEPLGMHIGGGKNTPEEKAPFHRALEQKFPAFMECYRLVEDPWSGGSFGVDIKVARAGGAPIVEQPRTRLRGAGFRECMLAAFGQVQFERPKAGPTVLSYSVLFSLGKSKR